MRTTAHFRIGLICLMVVTAATAQAPIAVPDGSSSKQILELANSVRPSARQLAWQATGFNAFVHFGMNTFTNREWGDGTEKPEGFAPTDFDAGQWATTFRKAGMKGVVMTCKHHDGFCLWPSATTDHDVAASPFRGGEGDVVGEVAEACRKQGLAFGVYLSPWDRNQKTFGTKAYEAVFLAQLTELLTNYGELFEVWFDGAHCPPDDPALFDWQAVFQLVRKLQPNAAIAITGPDVRWVGNEAGKTRQSEWSVLPLPQAAPGPVEQDRQSWRSLWQLRARNQAGDLGSQQELAKARALCWWPAETDVSIRPGWFYHAADDDRVRPLTTLLDYWFTAVGGNAVLLLNVPPDPRGQLAPGDVAVLEDLGRYLQATFATNLAQASSAKANQSGEVHFDQPTTVDVFDLAEDVATTGQRVEKFAIDVLNHGKWQQCATGTTIGFRRLLRTAPITGVGFRYRIINQRGKSRIREFGLFRRPILMQRPLIVRSRAGDVSITAGTLAVRYTTDGTPVTDASPSYRAPFPLPMGGTVRARAFAKDDSRGVFGTAAEATATFGLCSKNWQIVEFSSEQADEERAAFAIDGDPNTLWHTRYKPDTPGPPHHLTIDLAQPHTLTGFVYTPRATGLNGTIADYEFYGSQDGRQWQALAKGTFGNIANNPTAQSVRFARPAEKIRYVRLVARREANGQPWASVAELSVLVAAAQK